MALQFGVGMAQNEVGAGEKRVVQSQQSRMDVGSKTAELTIPGDDVETFSCTLIKKESRNKFGLAYRVVNASDVVITGVVQDSAAESWNAETDPGSIICTGDTIISANAQSLPRPIVDELLQSSEVNLTIQKTGPRWHIVGDQALRTSANKGDVPTSPTDVRSPSRTEASQSNIEYGESDVSQGVDQLTFRHFIFIALAVFGPNFVILAAFSDLGLGLKMYTIFAKPGRNNVGNMIVGMGSAALVIMVLLDWSKWESRLKKVASIIVAGYVICFGAIMKSRYYPFAPMVIILFHIPVVLGILRGTSCRKVATNSFYSGVALNSFVCAILVLLVWLLWMNFDGWDGLHRWNDDTKHQLITDSEEMYNDFEVEVNDRKRSLNYWWDCDTTYAMTVDYESIKSFRYWEEDWKASSYKFGSKDKQLLASSCARVKTIWFLVWASPLISGGVSFIIAVFGLMNSFLLNVHDTSKLEKVMKQFITMISFLVFTMYVSTSVAGASMRLTGVIMAFCASGLIALFVWLYMEIGRKAITSQVKKSKLMQSLIVFATSDWIRACVLIGLNILIPTFLVINMLNQKVRKMRGVARNTDQMFTQGMQGVIMASKNWNWASILCKANWLVIVYWTLSVGVAKLTYIFLSWLNETLLKISLVAVIVIFFIIGFTMFMLPPVPGIPVYICSGIVLSARSRDVDEVGNFWGGMCIAIVESLILKICAVCGQYYIGYALGKSVKVQQLVSVDKVATRAIEQILNVKGLNFPKVSILVGGPDWPTSVLCGILKLSLFQCCLGTLPVVFVSAPCVIAGAFMANPGAKTEDARRLDEHVANMTNSTEPTWQDLRVGKDQKGEIWDTLSTTALCHS